MRVSKQALSLGKGREQLQLQFYHQAALNRHLGTGHCVTTRGALMKGAEEGPLKAGPSTATAGEQPVLTEYLPSHPGMGVSFCQDLLP